ncbi:hypothetical protein [Fimbriiglobus ruber]|uniref:Carboxypeptidase regulatory-like domain-containing protein n=1 Tax=Fimbriiglobus ruber TaxID=1908690 RepID=A0A225DAG7_9BACT|nr:hypothetical protein [Fimbriiglobus ruber]OWK38580.1 hypothetical protein FRUB_07700 [Fimbriiglobus ruber]
MPWKVAGSRFASICVVVFFAAFAVTACGCAGKKPVAQGLDGVVIVKGKPLKSGTITFTGESGTVWTDHVRNGKFTITNVVPGKVKVTVEPAAGATGDVKAGVGKMSPTPDPALANLKEQEYTIAADQTRIEVKFP